MSRSHAIPVPQLGKTHSCPVHRSWATVVQHALLQRVSSPCCTVLVVVNSRAPCRKVAPLQQIATHILQCRACSCENLPPIKPKRYRMPPPDQDTRLRLPCSSLHAHHICTLTQNMRYAATVFNSPVCKKLHSGPVCRMFKCFCNLALEAVHSPRPL